MAVRIPIYTEQFQTPVGPGIGNAQILDPWAPALEIGRQAFEKTTDILQQKEDEDAAAWATTALAGAKSEWTKALFKRQESAEPGAKGFTPALMKDFDSYVSKTVGAAPNERAAQYLKSRLGDFGAGLFEDSLRFEAKSRTEWRAAQAGEVVRLNGNTLVADPSQFPAVLGDTTGAIRALGLPPQQAALMEISARQDLAAAALTGLIQKAPGQALKELKAGTWDPYLETGKKVAFINAAEGEMKRLQAEANARAAAANATWLSGADDEMALLRRGGIVTGSQYTPEAFVARFGEEKGAAMAKEYAQAAETGAMVREMGSMTDEEVVELLAAQRPSMTDATDFRAEDEQFRMLLSVADQRAQAMANDPAGYVIATDAAAREAFENLTTAMTTSGADVAGPAATYAAVVGAELERRTGQPAVALLPQSYVESVGKLFSQQPMGGESAATQVAALQQTWGKAWPQVYGQLVQAGALPAEAVVIGSGVPPAAANRLAEVSRSDLDTLKKGVRQSDLSGLEDAVAVAMDPFRKVLTNYAGGDAAFGSYFAAVQKMSLAYMRAGKSQSDAIEAAYDELIGSRFEFYDTFFVPKEEDRDEDVPSGAAAAQRDLSAYAGRLDLPRNIEGVPEEETRSQYVSTLQANGYWVTAPDQTGLVLMDPAGAAATIDGGKPLLLTWQQLRQLGVGNGLFYLPALQVP